MSEPTGAILAWEQADQLGSVGLLYVVLSLILVHGRTIADSTSLYSFPLHSIYAQAC